MIFGLLDFVKGSFQCFVRGLLLGDIAYRHLGRSNADCPFSTPRTYG
jgi:hypothetical protein